MSQLLQSGQREGTILISRSELTGLSQKQWEALYIVAYTHPQVRVVIYGDDRAPDDTRMTELRGLTNVTPTADDAVTALKYRLPHHPSIYLFKEGMSEDPVSLFGNELLKEIKLVRLGGEAEPIGLALLYLLTNGGLQHVVIRHFYLEDPNRFYLDKIGEFILQYAIAWSA